jgi:hypothetical protein
VIPRVDVAASVLASAHILSGRDRGPSGSPSEFDFVSGPLAAAAFAFRDFDNLQPRVIPAIRTYTILDSVRGPVTFAAVLLSDGRVEIIDFDDDPDYWLSSSCSP